MDKIKMGLIVFLGLALTITGCAKQTQEKAKKELEKQSGVETQIGKKVKVKDLPKEFLYPKAKAKSRTSVKSGETETITTIFETPHSMDMVKDHFDDEPDLRGWDQNFRQATEGGLSYMFMKGDLRSTVILTEHAKKTEITFSLNKPSK